MNYYDEGRPRVNYRPAYIDSVGRPIAPLPALSVLPLLKGGYRLGVWLRLSFNSARELHCEVGDATQLCEFLAAFMADPEAVLHERFGYEGMTTPQHITPVPAKPTLRLSDIGL